MSIENRAREVAQELLSQIYRRKIKATDPIDGSFLEVIEQALKSAEARGLRRASDLAQKWDASDNFLEVLEDEAKKVELEK